MNMVVVEPALRGGGLPVAQQEAVLACLERGQMVEDEVDNRVVALKRVVGPVWVDVKEFRQTLEENQGDFWGRFGVTQSAGSRYELSARSMPRPVRMLVIAFAIGLLNEKGLEKLRNATGREEEAGDE